MRGMYVEIDGDQIITIDAEQWRAETLHRKPHIDFNAVSFQHEKIDERLKNWARWAIPRGCGNVAPMFRHYRPDNYERDIGEPIDALDAQAVQKGVSLLPTRHSLAISWCYIAPGAPNKMARKMGESFEGLYMLIVDGRQMLINRRV